MIEPHNTALKSADVKQKGEHDVPEKTKQSLLRIKKRKASRKAERQNRAKGRKA